MADLWIPTKGAQETFPFAAGDTGGYAVPDNVPHYVGMFFSPTADPTIVAPTAAAAQWPLMKKAGTIRAIYFGIISAPVGTAETGTLAVRVNNGTDTVVFNNTLQWNATTTNYSDANLNIKLAVNDFFSLKVTPPVNFVTNPNSWYFAQIVVTFP